MLNCIASPFRTPQRWLCVLACLIALPLHSYGFLGFGKNPNDRSPAQQTAAASETYQAALQARADGRERSAMRGFKKVFEDFPAASFAGDALFAYAELQYERDNWKKSFEAFQRILIAHPDFPRFNELLRYQFEIAMACAEGKNTRFLFVIPFRALNRAVLYFETLVANAPFSDMAPLALMNVALIHQYKGETARSIDALDRLINSYPSSLLASDAYLSLAETFADLVQGPEYDQGATREAMSYFEDFLILYSQSQDLARAEGGLAEMEDVYARSKLIIGQYYFRWRKWYTASEVFFNEAITIAPDSDAAATAREYLERIEVLRANAPTPEEFLEREREKSFLRRLMERIIR